MKQCWLEINTDAITANCRRIIAKTKVDLMAVVKANGYGHGIVQTAKACERGGATMLAVADLDEAIKVRESGSKLPILIFNWLPAKFIRLLIDNDFIYSISDLEIAKELNEEARKLGRVVRANFCFDTGMHRFGVLPDDLDDFLATIANFTSIDIEGVFSHFAEPANLDFTNRQLVLFNNMLFEASRAGFEFKYTHIGRTGTLNFSKAYFDMTRCGLAIYGATKIIENLEPALEFKAIILSIKKIPARVKVGYGLTFETKRLTMLAVLAAGYSNGYDKNLSNSGEVLINFKKCPVVGRIGMNHTIVDVTDVAAKIGDEATLIGRQGEAEITAEALAEKIKTSAHEILANLPSSLERVYNSSDQ